MTWQDEQQIRLRERLRDAGIVVRDYTRELPSPAFERYRGKLIAVRVTRVPTAPWRIVAVADSTEQLAKQLVFGNSACVN